MTVISPYELSLGILGMYTPCVVEHIKQHMLHPHAWVRFATAQVFGLVFSTYNPDELVAAVLSLASHVAKRKKSAPADSEPAVVAQDVNKSHRSMMFLLKDTRQQLRDFTADFCTQFSSQFMEEEFASQVCLWE